MITAVAGGVLIGLAASLMLLFLGRIAGVSGITKGIFAPNVSASDLYWRISFLLGIFVTGGVYFLFLKGQMVEFDSIAWARIIPAAVLIGLGSAMANGCTSGHGVCGLGRRSKRSLFAIILFLCSGFLTTYILLHVLHFPRL